MEGHPCRTTAGADGRGKQLHSTPRHDRRRCHPGPGGLTLGWNWPSPPAGRLVAQESHSGTAKAEVEERLLAIRPARRDAGAFTGMLATSMFDLGRSPGVARPALRRVPAMAENAGRGDKPKPPRPAAKPRSKAAGDVPVNSLAHAGRQQRQAGNAYFWGLLSHKMAFPPKFLQQMSVSAQIRR